MDIHQACNKLWKAIINYEFSSANFAGVDFQFLKNRIRKIKADLINLDWIAYKYEHATHDVKKYIAQKINGNQLISEMQELELDDHLIRELQDAISATLK